MVKDGRAVVAYQPVPSLDLVNFFRVTMGCHPLLTNSDIDNLIQIFTDFSNDLEVA